jgi:hypothetical protein
LLLQAIEQNPMDFVAFPSVSEGKLKIAKQFYILRFAPIR